VPATPTPAPTSTPSPSNPDSFADLGLGPEVLRAIVELGFEAPTPIQAQAIPTLIAGADMIGQAQTGTGKTAAFALPLLERIDADQKCVQALILTPTRELALQVCEAIHFFSKYHSRIRLTPVYGGQPIVPQMKKIDRGAQIVVGTPGRVIDLIKRRALKMDRVRNLVLDEADEMLRMGFIDDVEWILAQAPEKKQLALFSATMPIEIKRIAERFLVDPVHIQIARKTVSLPNIEQSYLQVRGHEKMDVLVRVLETQRIDAALIFVKTKAGCSELASHLSSQGIMSEPLNGDMSQAARELAVRRIKSGKVNLLVATDVAARGLDIERISHVINYDIPAEVESYVHRIGRTGRAGNSGSTILFVTSRERWMLNKIERFMKSKIALLKMPSHEDIVADRKRQLADSLRAELSTGNLELYREVIEELAREGTFDLDSIAAAAARMASSDKPLDVPPSKSLAQGWKDAKGDQRPGSQGARKSSFRKRARGDQPRKGKGDAKKPRSKKQAAPRREGRKPSVQKRAGNSS
jgi:ATP-dependent RNA helicase DeaD